MYMTKGAGVLASLVSLGIVRNYYVVHRVSPC